MADLHNTLAAPSSQLPEGRWRPRATGQDGGGQPEGMARRVACAVRAASCQGGRLEEAGRPGQEAAACWSQGRKTHVVGTRHTCGTARGLTFMLSTAWLLWTLQNGFPQSTILMASLRRQHLRFWGFSAVGWWCLHLSYILLSPSGLWGSDSCSCCFPHLPHTTENCCLLQCIKI